MLGRAVARACLGYAWLINVFGFQRAPLARIFCAGIVKAKYRGWRERGQGGGGFSLTAVFEGGETRRYNQGD